VPGPSRGYPNRPRNALVGVWPVKSGVLEELFSLEDYEKEKNRKKTNP